MFRHYLISGRVQGVGYRRFAQKKAIELKINGRVRNLGDGRVEIFAEAEEGVLMRFESLLAEGPSFSQVKSVAQRTLEEPAFETQTFEIVDDGEAPWFA